MLPTLVFLYPVDKCVFPLQVLIDSRPFEYCVEGLLGVRLDDVLLVLHQLDYALENGEVLEARAH